MKIKAYSELCAHDISIQIAEEEIGACAMCMLVRMHVF